MSHSTSDHATTSRGDTVARVAESAAELSQPYVQHYVAEPAQDLLSLAKTYARDKPDVAVLWAFGIGVVIGWKIKPW